MIKQAIIPLAGLGTRLLPLTSVFAKELLPINGKPGLEYIINECIDAGIKQIIFIIFNNFTTLFIDRFPVSLQLLVLLKQIFQPNAYNHFIWIFIKRDRLAV